MSSMENLAPAPATSTPARRPGATQADLTQGPTSALIKLGEHVFEMDKEGNIRPYGDKPTLEQQTMAESLRGLVKNSRASGSAATYTPISGSHIYHGVYTVDPQKWLGGLLDTHQPDFTPDDIQPHPTMPGAWIFRNPDDGSYQIYK